MNNLNVKVDLDNKNQLTILDGKALEQMPPNRIKISGDIKTVSTFLKVRKEKGEGLQTVDDKKAIVLVDKNALTISLILDPENHYGACFTGSLQETEELKEFGINTTKTFTKEALIKLLKFSKLFFPDKDKHSEMLNAFQKTSSTVNISSNDSSDTRGNKERDFIKTVTTNAPTEFVLEIPIFKGFSAVKFRVEVCLDVTEGSVRFWFESVELHEIKQKKVTEIFEQELVEANGLVIINV